MAETSSTRDVIAFRLGAHRLAERLDVGALIDAAGACAIQNSPPGSALLALNARVEDLAPEQLDRAGVDEKDLLQTWSMSGSPFYFATADAPVFTTGALPSTAEAVPLPSRCGAASGRARHEQVALLRGASAVDLEFGTH